MARNNWHLPWEQYVETLKPHERPMMPGSSSLVPRSRAPMKSRSRSWYLVAISPAVGRLEGSCISHGMNRT